MPGAAKGLTSTREHSRGEKRRVGNGWAGVHMS